MRQLGWRRMGLVVVVSALVLAAACGDDGSDGSNAGGDTGGADTTAAASTDCEFVTASDVEAAFGGTVEATEPPEDAPPGTCLFTVEGADAGGAGQVAVLQQETNDDPIEAFELFCQIEEAGEIDGAGDRACYTGELQELFVLTGDEVFYLRAPIGEFFEDADAAQLEESFLTIGQTVAGE